MSAVTKLNAQATLKLVVQKGPHEGQRFTFSKAKITIGRSPENDIILLNDPLISRQHAYIQINSNDVEIINLSEKNPILVSGERVNKWKLINETVFTIGDSEFLVHLDNQQSVVVVKNNSQKKPESQVSPQIQYQAQAQKKPTMQTAKPVYQTAPVSQKNYNSNINLQSLESKPVHSSTRINPKIIIYSIIGLIIAIGAYFLMNDTVSNQAQKNKKSTLKYADETALKLNSKAVSDAFEKQSNKAKLKQTPSYIRAEENFNKGMRAYQQASYSSAIDYFQQTLNNQSEHVLAKRYLQLSKVRFDEILKIKLDLGQSYFERNNFKLCKSMFQQVIDMLKSKESLQVTVKDTNLQLAEIMLKKCEFAAEGIH